MYHSLLFVVVVMSESRGLVAFVTPCFAIENEFLTNKNWSKPFLEIKKEQESNHLLGRRELLQSHNLMMSFKRQSEKKMSDHVQECDSRVCESELHKCVTFCFNGSVSCFVFTREKVSKMRTLLS